MNAASLPHGVWRSRGYGWRLELERSGYRLLDVTDASIALAESGDTAAFTQAYDVLSQCDDRLVLRQRGDVTTYWFDSDSTAPPTRLLDEPDPNPAWTLEILWRHMRENYAFFDLRAQDWDSLYRCACARAATDMSAADLLDVCLDMLAPLQDAHVGIDAGDLTRDATSPIRERRLQIQRSFVVPAWRTDRQAYTHGLQNAFNELLLAGRGVRFANGLLQCARLDGDIGYLSVFGEFGYGDTDRARSALDLPRNRVEGARFLADELAGLHAGLDAAIAHLAGIRALIVDARLNYGGYDRIALDVAGRFCGAPRTAYRKKAFTPHGFVGEQDILVTPRAPTLTGLPIYLLTSRQTASAGEILAFAFSCLPNVTRVGEATLGILSDNLYKRLPIGWELSLSNEIYSAPDGALYEAVGIPPHVAATVFDPADIPGGFRHTVETAHALALARLSI